MNAAQIQADKAFAGHADGAVVKITPVAGFGRTWFFVKTSAGAVSITAGEFCRRLGLS